MSVNYDCVCRLCLSSRGELLPIFPTTSSDRSEPSVLASKIRDCVSVQINENDDLPTNVCRKCVDNVNNWHIFKSVCERAQNKLQSLIKKDGSQLEEVKIKSEPLSDEAYDDGVIIDGSYPDIENAGTTTKVQPEGPPILASLGLTPRSDKKYVDPRMDWHRVHAILNIIQEDDVIDSLQSTEECDVLQKSDHDSDTDLELLSEIDDTYVDTKIGYKCRNKKIISKDYKVSPKLNKVKIKEAAKLRRNKSPITAHCAKPLNAWQLLFTDDILELITISTNEHIVKVNGFSVSTNVSEIKTLIGILYLHGIMRPTYQKYSDLWHNQYGIICIKKAMTLDRFKFLLQNIRFDQEEEDSIVQLDIMKRMRKVFEIFAMNCRSAFDISNIVVVDEVIVPVYGPCPFRYSIDKKPLKCGMKMILLVDSANFYVSNLDIVTDPCFGPEEIIKKIVHHLAGTGKTIIMDSWYTSCSLIKYLKNEYQLYSIAALHPNDDVIPPVFLSKLRKDQIFMTGFLDNDVTVTSYVTTGTKCVNVMTNDPKFYKRSHVNSKTPNSVYKRNQSVVELVDVLMHYYTTMQNTNDWTLSLFFSLLNIASVNAQVIWSSQNLSNAIQRRLFIKDLGISLLQTDDSMLGLDESARPSKENYSFLHEILPPSFKGRRRCRICVKNHKRDRRTKQYCLKCTQFICREHTASVCTMCYN